MKQANRIRTLWALVALAAMFGLGAVVVYYLAGFGPMAFAVSLIVYSVILVAALLVAASNLTESPAAEPSSAQSFDDLESDNTHLYTAYEEEGRSVLRVDSGDPSRSADFLVVDGNTVRPLSEIEEELDVGPASARKAMPAAGASA